MSIDAAFAHVYTRPTTPDLIVLARHPFERAGFQLNSKCGIDMEDKNERVLHLHDTPTAFEHLRIEVLIVLIVFGPC